ncbi:hypothetical protein [Flavobacterium sp. FlaQc-47]|uniref:hypothetical protein n=1 Tax=Flavobacterium sp. FlaQc-47 TaxID=3374180 RepID=UPI0037573FAE
MKKLVFLLSALVLGLTSCSNDDNNSSDPSSLILVKKRIYTEANEISSHDDIVYNGDKIVSIRDEDGSVLKFTYTGDVITKTEEIDQDGKLDQITEYSYTNGVLATSIDKHPDEAFYYKNKYTHNSDGTVAYEQFRVNVVTGVEEEYGAIGKFTFKNGNITKLEVSYYGAKSSYAYEYDDKNNPFKNVLGYNLLLEDASANNVIKMTATSGSGDNIYTATTTNTYKYDSNNYPVELIESFQSGNSISTSKFEYFY